MFEPHIFDETTGKLTIDKDTKKIDKNAFQGDDMITHVDLNQVKTISLAAFRECKKLETITGNNVTEIDDEAFYGCLKLCEISFPNVKWIGKNVFENCESLQTINLPKVKRIGYGAFLWCTSLKTIDLPDVGHIENEAFRCCTNLTHANIPSINHLGQSAFASCQSLESVKLQPDNEYRTIHFVDVDAFDNCPNLEDIIISPEYLYVSQSMIQKNPILLNKESLKILNINLDVVLSSTHTQPLFPHTFSSCVGIRKINLMGTYRLKAANLDKLISPTAFRGCSNISEVTISLESYLSLRKDSKLDHEKTCRLILLDFLHLRRTKANVTVLRSSGAEISPEEFSELVKQYLNPSSG